MADFCRQCSIDLWGKDTQDLMGINKETELEEGAGFVVICEGCGFIRVDHAGQCLGDSDCIAHHQPPTIVHLKWDDSLRLL